MIVVLYGYKQLLNTFASFLAEWEQFLSSVKDSKEMQLDMEHVGSNLLHLNEHVYIGIEYFSEIIKL